MFDTLTVRMGFLELLADTFHVRTRLLQVRLQLLIIAVHLLVEREVRIVNLVVLLPGVTLWSAHDNLEPVILDGTRPTLGLTLLPKIRSVVDSAGNGSVGT